MTTFILVCAVPALILLVGIIGVLGWAIVTGNREAAHRLSPARRPTNVSHPLQPRSWPVTDAR